MAIIFYRENREDDEIIYKPTPAPTPEPPLIPMPAPTPKPPLIPMPAPTLSPEKQRYFELLKEYEALKQELLKCYGFPIPQPFLTRLLKAEEIDYEELNEKLLFEIRKLKQQIEQCKSRQHPPVPVSPEPPKPEAPIQTPPSEGETTPSPEPIKTPPSGGGATTPSPEPTPPEPKKAGFPAWLLILGLALIILLPKQNKEQR